MFEMPDLRRRLAGIVPQASPDELLSNIVQADLCGVGLAYYTGAFRAELLASSSMHEMHEIPHPLKTSSKIPIDVRESGLKNGLPPHHQPPTPLGAGIRPVI
jgi:hypothetical protein